MELNVIIYCPGSYSIPYIIVVEKYDLFCPEMSNISLYRPLSDTAVMAMRRGEISAALVGGDSLNLKPQVRVYTVSFFCYYFC